MKSSKFDSIWINQENILHPTTSIFLCTLHLESANKIFVAISAIPIWMSIWGIISVIFLFRAKNSILCENSVFICYHSFILIIKYCSCLNQSRYRSNNICIFKIYLFCKVRSYAINFGTRMGETSSLNEFSLASFDTNYRCLQKTLLFKAIKQF